MSIIGITAGIFGSIFFVSSVAHALFNAVYRKDRLGNVTLLHLHYAALYCFTMATILYGYRYFDTYASALALVLPFWIALHLLRGLLDWTDGKSSRRKDVVIRHWSDALANITTMVFVLSVAATHDPWLIWIALGLSMGMWGKEFLFRSYTDIVERKKNKRKTAQQGPGRASPEHFVVMHGLANRLSLLHT